MHLSIQNTLTQERNNTCKHHGFEIPLPYYVILDHIQRHEDLWNEQNRESYCFI